MFPKKYHGPEVKCSGYGRCPDCTERIDKGIPYNNEIFPSEIIKPNDPLKLCCNCDPFGFGSNPK